MPVINVHNSLAEKKIIFYSNYLDCVIISAYYDLLYYKLQAFSVHFLMNSICLNSLNMMKYDFLPCTVSSLRKTI